MISCPAVLLTSVAWLLLNGRLLMRYSVPAGRNAYHLSHPERVLDEKPLQFSRPSALSRPMPVKRWIRVGKLDTPLGCNPSA